MLGVECQVLAMLEAAAGEQGGQVVVTWVLALPRLLP